MKTRKNFLRNLAVVIATILTVTSICNYTTMAADSSNGETVVEVPSTEEPSTEEVSTEQPSTEEPSTEIPSTEETSPEDPPVEEEKELLQYCNDWTIFRTTDSESGNPIFEVKYMEKTIEDLAKENISLQYRIIYKNEEEFKLVTSSWYNWEETLPEETKEDITNNKDKYYIQFQFLDNLDINLSTSETLLIWPQENPFPYILSSNIDYCEVYNLNYDSSAITVELKYSDNLQTSDIFYINRKCSIENYLLASGCSIKNQSYTNFTETVEVDDKEYTIAYSTLSFDLQLSTMCYVKDVDNFVVNYVLIINGIQGCSSTNTISNFMLNVCTPTEQSTDESVLIENIKLSAPSTSVKAGDTIAITANILPENATNKELEWYSGNNNFAVVDQNGSVTTTMAGIGQSVVIIAYATDGSGERGKITLSIVGNTDATSVTGIAITASNNSVLAGEKVKLTTTVAPENATNKSLTWSSSNEEYATVDQNGIVTTTSAGAGKSVTITAKANDSSNVSANYTLQIKSIPVKSISVTSTSSSIAAGKKVTLTANVSPANATTKSVKWSSSNNKYATVNANGIVTTTAAGAGKTVTITAKSTDGSNKEVSFKLKIKKVSVKKVKITGKKTVKAGKKLTLKATVTPSNATNTAVKWTSSNKKYATVNSKGVVTAKKAGKGKTVKITATAKDGSKKKSAIKIKIK